MSARTDKEKRRVTHIKGKHPLNVARRSAVVAAFSRSKERHRSAWLEVEGVREQLDRVQSIFDEYFHARAHKELKSVPDSTGKGDAEDCDWCAKFRDIHTSVCPNCGKPAP